MMKGESRMTSICFENSLLPEFNFMGFTPTESLLQKAKLTIDRLLQAAPYGAIAVAMIEKTTTTPHLTERSSPEAYRCVIEIYSQHGPFTAHCSHSNCERAVEKVTQSLEKKLLDWKLRRNLVGANQRPSVGADVPFVNQRK
jgi:ribosome-associated translation inhibitor RaiA